MKLLHLGDLHIGKVVNSFSMLEDQRFALREILGLIDAHGVQAVLLAGDIYDKSSPSAEAVDVFSGFLSELAARMISVFAIPGNHDSAERLAYAQGILCKQNIHFAPVFNGSLAPIVLEDEFGPVKFWLLPFLKPASVRPFFPEEDIGQDYSAAIKLVLDSCGVDTHERNVLLAHQFVTHTNSPTEREDSELQLGGIDNVDASVFQSFDYVALGHVHRPQKLGRETLRYSGSLLKYSFSEANYPKSAVLVEVGEKKSGKAVGACMVVKKLNYPLLRDMRKIRGTLEELTHGKDSSDVGNSDYLHITLTNEHAVLDAMSRLRAVYPNAMQLEYASGRSEELHLQALESGKLAQLQPIELFERFYAEQAGTSLSETQQEIASAALNRALQGKSPGEGGAL